MINFNKKIYWISAIFAFIIIIFFSYPLILPLFTDNNVNEDYPIMPLSRIENTGDSTSVITNNSINNSVIIDNIYYELHGLFIDGDKYHKTSGNAIIISDTNSSTKYLRLEDFKTTNGPDLYVYLATDSEAIDFINLGVLKGNIGNQNYEIPKNTDLNKYSKVLIWCEDFSVLFGSANLE